MVRPCMTNGGIAANPSVTLFARQKLQNDFFAVESIVCHEND